jgi:hypothetical protein
MVSYRSLLVSRRGIFSSERRSSLLNQQRLAFSILLHNSEQERQARNAEVDYVIVHKGCVTPVEVKSGSRGTLKSLALYQEKFTPAQCLVLSMKNSVEIEQIRWVPLFLASRLL